MADSSARSRKKRKLKSTCGEQKHSKARLVIDSSEKRKESEEVEGESSDERGPNDELCEGLLWKNLQLILSLQSKGLDVEKKVDLAFKFVEAREAEGYDIDEDYDTVRLPRLIVFISDWIQSLLISPGRKLKVHGDKDLEACLDFRCWEVFGFCLKKSSELCVSLSLSRNLLRPIGYVARNVLSVLNSMPLPMADSFLTGQGFEVYGSMNKCLGMLFSLEGSFLNENLDLWLSTIEAIIELLNKVYADKLYNCKAGAFVHEFSCTVLEPFSKFLRIHPCRKNGFKDFVDKLLGPILYSLGYLHIQADENDLGCSRTLLKLVEDNLSHGLFHSAHIDGFLDSNSTEKHVAPEDGKSKSTRMIPRSYHRHFFDKIQSIVREKKVLELSSIGELLHLLVQQVSKLKRGSSQTEHEKLMAKTRYSTSVDDSSNFLPMTVPVNDSPVETNVLLTFSAEVRKSVFDFFVQLMEPLLVEMHDCLQGGGEVGLALSNVHCILKSVNGLLSNLIQERIYVKTEDISGGACLNFLKNVYSTIISVASSLLSLPKCDIDDTRAQRMFLFSSKELLVAVGQLLDIEYDVIENDLVGLWSLILTCMAYGVSFAHAQDQCSANAQIIGLSCRLVYLHSELRQVDSTIFAMCKALRLLVSHDTDDREKIHTSFLLNITSSPETTVKSVEVLFSSQELRLSICDAIKSIPEGQASGCVRQLVADISESLEWIKHISLVAGAKTPDHFILLTEVLGRGLSEIYSLVLDSLTCTGGNCNLIGQSINNLMDVIRPFLSILVSPNPGCMKEFFIAVTGRDLEVAKKKSRKHIIPTYWINVFFLRLYMSCRSLCRQVISFMPPDMAKKMAGKMGHSLAACSGNDWVEKTDWNDEGYFTWIIQPSASLMEILTCISHTYSEGSIMNCGALIYTLHAMALQRLVDLNSCIKSLNYILLRNENLGMTKISRKLKKHISVLRQEAVHLTDFVLGYLSIVADNKNSFSVDCVSALKAINNCDRWEFCISAIDKGSLPTALWWIICQSVDIWCSYAAKNKLKEFLSILIHTSIPCKSSCFPLSDLVGKHELEETAQMKNLMIQQISSELMIDSDLYEHQFVRRHLASMFRQILETTALQIFKDLLEGETDFYTYRDWTKSLNILETVYQSGQQSNSSLHRKLRRGNCKEEANSQTTTKKFEVCQSLLNLLCWMQKGYFKSRFFELCVMHTLDIERLVVVSLSRYENKFSRSDLQNLYGLFACCRRTLKNIVTTSCEKTAGDILSRLLPLTSDVTSLALWLFKSVFTIIDLQSILVDDSGSKAKDMSFSLMGHTSCIFLTISRYQSSRLVPKLIGLEQSSTGQDTTREVCNQNILDKSDSGTFETAEDWRHILALAEILAEQAEDLEISLMNCIENPGNGVGSFTLNKMSCIVSCFGGFLWGLGIATEELSIFSSLWKASSEQNSEEASKFSRFINTFLKFTTVFVKLLCIENAVWPEYQSSARDFMESDGNRSQLVLSGADLVQTHHLKKYFMHCLLKGEHPEAAFALRQLLTSCAAILRLNLQMSSITLPPWLLPTITGISQVMLSGLAGMVEVPQQFSFIWLDAVVKCLEEFVGYFCSGNPISTRDLYSKLIELQLGAVGKCISLQGKGAALPSLQAIYGMHVSSKEHPCKPDFVDEFRGRLRMSLKRFIEKSSELHLLSAIQAIERGLVGVWGTCSAVYSIRTGDSDGGKVSSAVAASIDALDLILEHASGRKRLNVVKRHIQSLIAALFNIIVHLQSPIIFCTKAVNKEDHNQPDAGAVILMCVEILTRISGKHAVFRMDSWHVSQCLRVPGALFQDLLRSCFVAPVSGSFSLYPNNKQCDTVASTNDLIVDRAFSINLFAACCRLLHMAVKHHKSETEHCLATLEESVSVLLHCLEIVGHQSFVERGYFSWKSEEGVKCASFLRRIYEELRQQKEVFGQHCFKFLSAYICVYSGYGPRKMGIRRAVDEALRPGVYALIDACSPSDFQYLHTVFGEGPCRNTLANLQHDYKLHFRYEGKV